MTDPVKFKHRNLKYLSDNIIRQLKKLTCAADGSLIVSGMSMLLEDLPFNYHTLNSRPCHIYWLELDKKIIAWSYLKRLYRYDDQSEIAIYVDPSYRCQGYGSFLVSQILNYHKDIDIIARPWNSPGLSFYDKINNKHSYRLSVIDESDDWYEDDDDEFFEREA